MFTKIGTHLYELNMWLCEKKSVTWPLGGTITEIKQGEGSNYPTVCSTDLKIGMQCLFPKVPWLSKRTFAYLEKHGRHRPMSFEHLLDKVNEGRPEPNSLGLFDTWPLRSVKNWKEIGHQKVPSHFSSTLIVGYITGFFTHMHMIFIPNDKTPHSEQLWL